jgi:hypothetical protein
MHWVGDGFHVRNLFPSNDLDRQVSPFLMLDYAGPTTFEPSERPRGVGEHPHRGFETVTIVYQGELEHRDSAGNSGTIGPGDVQWMTAASGVVHEEMHERQFARRGGAMEMIQLWVNLPKVHKMTAPRYQTLLHGAIPSVPAGAASSVRVIAGEFAGHKGPANTFTPVTLWDVRIAKGERLNLTLPDGHNAALFLRRGDIVVNGSGSVTGEAKLAVLDAEGEIVELQAKEDSSLLVMSGEPIREPVARYGPFVMNTRQELMQAVDDYQAGKMGRLR